MCLRWSVCSLRLPKADYNMICALSRLQLWSLFQAPKPNDERYAKCFPVPSPWREHSQAHRRASAGGSVKRRTAALRGWGRWHVDAVWSLVGRSVVDCMSAWETVGPREFVGPNCARNKTCSDGPPYWMFWAPPHRRRFSLQCPCLLNTEQFFLLFIYHSFFFCGIFLFTTLEIRGSTSIVPLKVESSSSRNHAPPSCGRNREKKSSFRRTSWAASFCNKKKRIFISASAALSFTRD